MSTMGPLCPEQLTQEGTLEEICVGPQGGKGRSFDIQKRSGRLTNQKAVDG
jgi:hypothetical protein